MRFAYADPPYIGQAKKHYAKEAKAAGRVASEVDHEMLIECLRGEYEAWALSLSSPSLEEILHICRRVLGPNKVRVCSWVKPFASFKKGVNPAYAWEPIIVFGGRKLGAKVPTVRDWVSANITTQRGTSGVKPDTFSYWLFEFVGLAADDEFVDVFPGSGAVKRAFSKWQNQGRLIAEGPPCDLCGTTAEERVRVDGRPHILPLRWNECVDKRACRMRVIAAKRLLCETVPACASVVLAVDPSWSTPKEVPVAASPRTEER